MSRAAVGVWLTGGDKRLFLKTFSPTFLSKTFGNRLTNANPESWPKFPLGDFKPTKYSMIIPKLLLHIFFADILEELFPRFFRQVVYADFCSNILRGITFEYSLADCLSNILHGLSFEYFFADFLSNILCGFFWRIVSQILFPGSFLGFLLKYPS